MVYVPKEYSVCSNLSDIHFKIWCFHFNPLSSSINYVDHEKMKAKFRTHMTYTEGDCGSVHMRMIEANSATHNHTYDTPFGLDVVPLVYISNAHASCSNALPGNADNSVLCPHTQCSIKSADRVNVPHKVLTEWTCHTKCWQSSYAGKCGDSPQRCMCRCSCIVRVVAFTNSRYPLPTTNTDGVTSNALEKVLFRGMQQPWEIAKGIHTLRGVRSCILLQSRGSGSF